MTKMTLEEFCNRIRDIDLFERRTSYYTGFLTVKSADEWVEEFLKFHKLPNPRSLSIVDDIIDRIENDKIVE